MEGADVRAVQGLLNARFVELHRKQYRVKVTGQLDHATIVAIKRFQRLRHLKVTGKADDRTYGALTQRLAPKVQKLKITVEGVHLVASFEGRRLCPYLDAVGIPTIGYGHTAGVTMRSSCLSASGATRLLNRDLSLFATGVTRLVKVPLSTRAFNGYVSFSYNVGLGAFGSSTVLASSTASTTPRPPTT
jgi:GH24 family phage-related lysozyme (muramidase)